MSELSKETKKTMFFHKCCKVSKWSKCNKICTGRGNLYTRICI